MRSLNSLLEPLRTESGLPALGAVVIRNYKIEAFGVVGKRRIEGTEPVKPNDPFHIGSTKSMTATLMARLVEKGKLHWDSPIGELLPQIRPRIAQQYWQVTIEQLLTHRSGLPEDRVPHLPLLLKLRTLDSKQRLQAAEWILQQEPVAQPGEKMLYSNGGYVVAGAIAEVVAGKVWETLIQDMLFRPLGIRSAGFGAPTKGAYGHRTRAGEYVSVPPSPLADNPLVLAPAGTVHLSLQDWARYAILHLKGACSKNPPLLRTDTFTRMHTPPSGSDYAMGWGVSRSLSANRTVLQHAGSNTMWFAWIQLVREAGMGFLVATNAGDENAQNTLRWVLGMLRQQAGV
ncbi:MAG: penicillin-binding protein [Armatimonadota bacterium]